MAGKRREKINNGNRKGDKVTQQVFAKDIIVSQDFFRLVNQIFLGHKKVIFHDCVKNVQGWEKMFAEFKCIRVKKPSRCPW